MSAKSLLNSLGLGNIVACLLMLLWVQPTYALTANQVAFEFRPNGRYRVNVYYTIPAVKEFRQAYVEFTRRKDAEAYYFKILRGADFYLDDPSDVRFINEPLNPEPW
jgi:hypothetical protein